MSRRRLRLPPIDEAFGWRADDTAGRTEPETVDVWADQAPTRDWLSEPYSDVELDIDVRLRLGGYVK